MKRTMGSASATPRGGLRPGAAALGAIISTNPRRRPSTAWPGLRSNAEGGVWSTHRPSKRPADQLQDGSQLSPAEIRLDDLAVLHYSPPSPSQWPNYYALQPHESFGALLTSSAPSILFPCVTGLLASLWWIRVYGLQLAIPSVVC